MIFVTIGTQEPFDRLIKAIDEIAPTINEQIIVQAPLEKYVVVNFDTCTFISPERFSTLLSEATLIISHAGMGTIISALVINKPIIVMPRLLKYNEHRNDHQLATANKFKALNYVHVADDESELKRMVLNNSKGELESLHKLNSFASKELLQSLNEFINR